MQFGFKNVGKFNSVKETWAKCFVVHILKFEIFQITWKKWNQGHQILSFQFFADRFWCFLFCFFMWFASFQILISEPQSIWQKLLVLSWLYSFWYMTSTISNFSRPNTKALATFQEIIVKVLKKKLISLYFNFDYEFLKKFTDVFF